MGAVWDSSGSKIKRFGRVVFTMKVKRCGRARFVISVMRPFVVIFALAGRLLQWLVGAKDDALVVCALTAAGIIAGVLVVLRTTRRLERLGYESPLVLQDGRIVHPNESFS